MTLRLRRFLPCCLALGALMMSNAPVRAQTLADSPARAVRNGAFFDDVSHWELIDGRARSSLQSVAVTDAPTLDDAPAIFGRALQITARPREGDNPWGVQVRQNLGVSLAAGETVTLSFWARSPQSVTIGAMIEADGGDAKVVYAATQLTPAWKHYEIEGAAPREFGAEATQVNFHVGRADATIEIADVRVQDPAHPLPAPMPLAPTERGSLQTPLSLLPNADFSASWQAERVAATPFIAQINGATHQAVRVEIAEKTDNPWQAKFAVSNPRALVGGDAVALRIWARSPTSNPATFVFQQSSAPFDKLLRETAALTPDWKEYRFVFALDGATGFAPNASNFEVHLGAQAGTVELANPRLDSYGPAGRAAIVQLVGGETLDYYGGALNSREWLAPALARIEQIRKAPLRVRVVDAKGKPVAGAQVKVEMTRHAFRWGTAAPASLLADHTDPAALKFQSELARLFNTVTLENDLKWHDVSAAQQRDIDAAFEWMKAHDIQVRGHNLVWGSFKFLPKTLDGKPAQELTSDEWRAVIARRVAEQAGRYKGQVYAWDVVNEAVNERDLWDKIGWDAFVETFKLAHQADPGALLIYNDYVASGRRGDTKSFDREREIIKLLDDAGAPLDMIGEQAHLGAPLIPMPRILKNLDELAALGHPIEITEFDVGLKDAQVNGDYVRDFLIAAFSHPKVEAIVQWGFWQNAHWRAKDGAGLFARDWTPLPAEIAYEDLVLNKWWTRANGTTAANGSYDVRGFLGDYQVTVTRGAQTQSASYALSKTSPVLTVTLK